MIIKNWSTRKFKNEVLTNLEKNGELVGVFIRQDARRRLSQVSEPKWGGKYRRGALVPMTNYEVEKQSNGVEIRVGLQQSAEGTFLDDKTSRHFGFYIEMGSRRFGPHPYLRPAVSENSKQIVKLLESG